MLDIVNILYILTIFIIFNRYYNIPTKYLFILLLHLSSIFLFNGFLFEPTYMPDQFNYLSVAQNIRNFDFLNENNFNAGRTVYIAGLFFGFFPIPFIDSLYSIGMINFLLYLYIFIFMYKKGFLYSHFILYFYLLYPSLLLYSSCALRDMLIFFIMFFGVYYILIRKKNVIGFSVLYFLTFVKFQNFIIFITSVLFTKKINTRNYFITGIIVISIIFSQYIDFFSLEKLNYYRHAFYNENLSDIEETFVHISSYLELIKEVVPSILILMFRPLPWKEFGILQFIQFIENCIICLFIIFVMFQNFKYKLWKMQEVKFLNIFLLLALSIYGLVIYNSGTAVRYKFPFITIYIIYSWYFIYKAKQFYEKKIICVE